MCRNPPTRSPGHADTRLKQFAEAEGPLRESLGIRDQLSPDYCVRHVNASLLGAALAGQKLHAEAEPLLRANCAGLKKRERTLPPHARAHLAAAVERLAELCEATGKKEEAARWRNELEAMKKSGK